MAGQAPIDLDKQAADIKAATALPGRQVPLPCEGNYHLDKARPHP